jgi:hypothetical protein
MATNALNAKIETMIRRIAASPEIRSNQETKILPLAVLERVASTPNVTSSQPSTSSSRLVSELCEPFYPA